MLMDCEHIREQLGALVDGELDAAARPSVEAHLAECTTCRAEFEALNAIDAALVRAVRDDRHSAQSLAERVIQQRTLTPLVARPRESKLRRWVGYGVAAAIGFAAAAVLFQPRENADPDRVARNGPASSIASAVKAPVDNLLVAQLVHTAGTLLFRAQNTDEWQPVPSDKLANFRCPSNSAVRTESGALCELQTSTGSRIRLNEKTEISLSAADEIELVTGQLWCRAPETAALRVVTTSSPPAEAVPATPWKIVCPSESECVTSTPENGAVRVIAAAGTVEVDVDGAAHHVAAGMVCTTHDGAIDVRRSADELLTASRWMQPLLTLDGHNSPELSDRVNALLARIGAAKVSYLFEQDIRHLGEYGALPLLKFVKSADPDQERERRQSAMRILADTAPIWTAPELIDLLDDPDAAIRVLADRTLTRLTRASQGLSPEDWQSDRTKWAPGVAGWRAWWTQHNFSCTPPPAGVPMRSPKDAGGQESLLKARNSNPLP